MQNIFNIIQIIIACLLTTAIILQQKGVGLSSAFGGEGGVYRVKRGAEKLLFTATIILTVLFLGVAFANLLIR